MIFEFVFLVFPPEGRENKLNLFTKNQYEYRYGIKLKTTTADAAVLKLLRKHVPSQSLSELRGKIQAHDYVVLSDIEKYDGERRTAKLLREFDRAGIETELFEEHRDTLALWQSEPISREYFKNILQRNREIAKETMIDIECEAEGFVSPEAMEYISVCPECRQKFFEMRDVP